MSDRRCRTCNAGVAADARVCPMCGEAIPALAVASPVAVARPVATAVPAARPPAFAVAPYKAVSGATVTAVVLMASGGLIAAAVVGAFASFVGQFFYLVVLFPLGIGLAVGLPIAGLAKWSRMHSVGLAALVGLGCGVVAMLAMHYCDYLLDLNNGLPPIPFPTYLDFKATAGVRIGKGDGLNLGYTGSFIYWGVEMLIVAVIVLLCSAAQAGSPFCVACNDWKKEMTYGPLLRDPDRAKELVEAGRVAELRRDDDEPADREERAAARRATTVQLVVAVCPHCRGEESAADVKLQRVTETKDGKSASDLCHVSYPGDAVPAILRAVDAGEA